jgi:hypothetical protein
MGSDELYSRESETISKKVNNLMGQISARACGALRAGKKGLPIWPISGSDAKLTGVHIPVHIRKIRSTATSY